MQREGDLARLAICATALLTAMAAGHGSGAAQMSFGGQLSVTNLGTEEVKVGETLGVGARLGMRVFENDKGALMIEGVGEAMFPPCEGTLTCGLFGAQINLLAFIEYSERALIYAGLGPAFQSFTLVDEGEGVTVDGSSIGFSMIIGTAWTATPSFAPYFEIRLSAMKDMRTQSAGSIGFRITPSTGSR